MKDVSLESLVADAPNINVMYCFALALGAAGAAYGYYQNGFEGMRSEAFYGALYGVGTGTAIEGVRGTVKLVQSYIKHDLPKLRQ